MKIYKLITKDGSLKPIANNSNYVQLYRWCQIITILWSKKGNRDRGIINSMCFHCRFLILTGACHVSHVFF